MSESPIRVALPEEIGKVTYAMTIAFAADPFMRWMYPDADAYVKHFPKRRSQTNRDPDYMTLHIETPARGGHFARKLCPIPHKPPHCLSNSSDILRNVV